MAALKFWPFFALETAHPSWPLSARVALMVQHAPCTVCEMSMSQHQPQNPTSVPPALIDKRALLHQAALEYHQFPKPGKLAISATKPRGNQHDLALAYSPGVAAPCEEIVKDPNAAFKYTSRGNLVAVISNGTAVLGLGDIGALASKPVMEGKAILFKNFAGIDAFPIAVAARDPEDIVRTVARIEPGFGGVNLEDI